jgi:hypothetical protein
MYAGRERVTDLCGITFRPGPSHTDYHVHLAMRNMTAKWKWIPLISGALVVLLAGQTRLHAASSQTERKISEGSGSSTITRHLIRAQILFRTLPRRDIST